MRWTYDDQRGRAGVLMWLAQAAVAGLFLYAGSVKLSMPADALAKVTPFSVPFIRFIGVCEVLGAVGLILPGLLRIREELTPLAALGLLVIMLGAVTTTVVTMPAAYAALPFVTGLLCAYIAYRRVGLLRRRFTAASHLAQSRAA